MRIRSQTDPTAHHVRGGHRPMYLYCMVVRHAPNQLGPVGPRESREGGVLTAITLEKVVDKTIDQAPLLIGIGIAAWLGYKWVAGELGVGVSSGKVTGVPGANIADYMVYGYIGETETVIAGPTDRKTAGDAAKAAWTTGQWDAVDFVDPSGRRVRMR